MRSFLLILVLLLAPNTVRSQVVFDQSTTNYASGAGATVSFSATTAGSNRALTACIHSSSTTVTGVTYNSIAMTELASVGPLNSHYGYLFFLINPTVGSNTLEITLADTGADVLTALNSFTGVHQSVSTGTPVSTSGTLQNINIDVASASNELVTDCLSYYGDANSVNATSPQTERAKVDNTAQYRWSATSTKPGNTSVNMAWTWNDVFEYVGLMGVSIKPSAATVTTVGQRIIRID